MHPINILVVDDNATNRKLLCAQLEAEGYAVLQAVDGVDALAVLESKPVDALFSDILMPHMDGYRLCHRIRQHAKFSALPIILCTSTSESASDRALAGFSGADGYLTKPASTPVILQALNDAMKEAKKRNPMRDPPLDEAHILHEYSEVLMQKLEAKNSELRHALEKIQQAHEAILDLNRDLERRVEQRTAQLEALNKELEAFSYSVSHDLRSPLNTIDGFSQLLVRLEGEKISDKGGHCLSRIRAATRQMSELIEGLLSLAQLSHDQLRSEVVDLSTIARDVAQAFREREPERQVQINIQDGLLAHGDPRLLSAVMHNLLGNAWKFTSKQTAAQIDVGSAFEANGQTVYFVKDNGAGFDMAFAEKLFVTFERLHLATDFSGTGVGLTTVKRVIDRHGGRIWADSSVNEGASFYFTLEPAPATSKPDGVAQNSEFKTR